MSVGFDDPLTRLSGVGPALAKRLSDGLNLTSVRDLLEHVPRTYLDSGAVLTLADVTIGEPATLIGVVEAWSVQRIPKKGSRRALDKLDATVRHRDGGSFHVVYFNQRFRQRTLPVGTVAAFSGKVGEFRGVLQLNGPEVQPIDSDEMHTGTIVAELAARRYVAVYRACDGISQAQLARLIDRALTDVTFEEDWLGPIAAARGLISLRQAFLQMHQPDTLNDQMKARQRLVFDELFALQLGLQLRRAQFVSNAVGVTNPPEKSGYAAKLITTLPFTPTGAQLRAFDEIGQDLAAPAPMHRLLQGDVGSGKTLVALWSMLCAVDNSRQAVIMAPTAVLAEQHYRTLTGLLAPFGVNVLDSIRVALLTSSATVNQRRKILGELLSGDIDLLVGTHAILEDGVMFADLGVVVIDEQHRFGVSQRVRLREKSAGSQNAAQPDVLVMTATPIPRSLALTVHGDLDVSVLDELPAGRQPITTQLITPNEAHRRDKVYAFIREEIARGQRAYIVCPFVEPSDAIDARAAVAEYERLNRDVFVDENVGLLHGRMSSKEKDDVMAQFRDGTIGVLVATTVIEVGVDVPDATIMVIEDAERFGISQLHQLRGRVGRGSQRSYCVLFAGWSNELSDEAAARLDAVVATQDGFLLAETDLELRGEGQLFGEAQSGHADLKIARLIRDLDVIYDTQVFARQVLHDDPQLAATKHAGLRREVLRRFAHDLTGLDALATG
ncbi:MAG: ATP-dependent DNA helicase RecG [Nitriliruptoraceae bacterium]